MCLGGKKQEVWKYRHNGLLFDPCRPNPEIKTLEKMIHEALSADDYILIKRIKSVLQLVVNMFAQTCCSCRLTIRLEKQTRLFQLTLGSSVLPASISTEGTEPKKATDFRRRDRAEETTCPTKGQS